MKQLRVAACQLNVVVGDLDGNVDKILRALETPCDVAVFTELAITGYPPEDLLLKRQFVDDNLAALDKVAAATMNNVAIVGFVARHDDRLYNAVAICSQGSVQATYEKRLLPNYAVFDEDRYFEAGTRPLQLFEIGGVRVGVCICEDAWFRNGPVEALGQGGAELIIDVNASPFAAQKLEDRRATLAQRTQEAGAPLLYVNQVGGQDELVFDGGTMLLDATGQMIGSTPRFIEEIVVFDVPVPARALEPTLPVLPITAERASDSSLPVPQSEKLSTIDAIRSALVLGTRDYIQKNGFADVVVGLSGGIDSSLVAAVAVEALGAAHVHGVLMPSRYSSDHSITDAVALAEALGIETRTIAIEPAHQSLVDMLEPSFGDRPEDLTEENLQSRIRGVLLMALSNKFGWLVLTTGNKSEMAVGYSTLYGDTAGAFAVIKDVSKTRVFEVCRLMNDRAGRELIPETVLTKPPSAELRPDQRDDQSLPPYDVLDPILEAYVEQDMTGAEVEALGFDSAVVRHVVGLVDRSEYKRRQMPPGIRVTEKAFGKDRRMPITSRYRA